MKKHFKIALYLLMFTQIIISCKKDEITGTNKKSAKVAASFTVDKETGTIPLTIKCKNNSTNAVSYIWDFGDGITSTEKDPTHTYSANPSNIASFTIKLTAKGVDNSDSIFSKTITVNQTARISSMSNNYSSIINTYEYDSKWRLIKVGNVTYEYTNSSVIEKTYSNGVYFTNTYTLNSKGLATKLTSYTGSVSNFEYNADGYLIKSVSTYNGNTSITTNTISNGNIVSSTVQAFSQTNTISYGYYTEYINSIGAESMGMAFLGKQNKNLQKSLTISGYTTTYTYTMDAKNRVAKHNIGNGYYISYAYSI